MQSNIEELKSSANAAYARGELQDAIAQYSRAVEASEQLGCPDHLHILYSNRWGLLHHVPSHDRAPAAPHRRIASQGRGQA
jgi:hypothetical protein